MYRPSLEKRDDRLYHAECTHWSGGVSRHTAPEYPSSGWWSGLNHLVEEAIVEFIQQTPECADFDVVLTGEGTPAFRMLLPETVMADDIWVVKGFHAVPGEWETTEYGYRGTIGAEGIRSEVLLQEHGDSVLISLGIGNERDEVLADVSVDICTAVNHLPGAPGWANSSFIPESLPLDRDIQGTYWFEKITPYNLMAFTTEGWVDAHPFPDDPRADSVPQYSFTPSLEDDASAIAVAAINGNILFYQAWDSPCRYCTPCPGNACMHLHPRVAVSLPPGETAYINGLIGMYEGNRDQLAVRIARFRERVC